MLTWSRLLLLHTSELSLLLICANLSTRPQVSNHSFTLTMPQVVAQTMAAGISITCLLAQSAVLYDQLNELWV